MSLAISKEAGEEAGVWGRYQAQQLEFKSAIFLLYVDVASGPLLLPKPAHRFGDGINFPFVPGNATAPGPPGGFKVFKRLISSHFSF